MPQTSMQELHANAAGAKQFLDGHLVDFLELKHTNAVGKKLGNDAATDALKPVESFEMEVKNKMSNAAHEMLQAINRIEDSMRQNSNLDVADFLRYARTNLEEAEREITAAEHAYKALETYHKRIEKASVVMGKELENLMATLFSKLEELKSFQKTLFEKIVLLINEASVD